VIPDALPADHDDGEDEAPLRALLEDQRLSRFAIRGDPPEHLTDWQRSVIASPHKHTVAWGANGIGKSLVIAEITRRALAGQLHWQRGAGPRTVMLVGNTWQQLGSTLAYLWRFVDKRWFRPGLRFEGGRVMGQRLAVFDIIAGPGRGGELRCGTFRAENLAGPRAEVVITDEPLPEDVYNELWPRLLGRAGRLYQTFTPTLGTEADLGYLWKLVDDPTVPFCGQIQGELTLDSVTPRRPPGSLLPDLPWITTTEIEEQVAGLSAMEADMRLGRSRHPRLDCAYFSAWGPHLVAQTKGSPGARLAVGIDHGSAPGRQRATLSAVSGHGLHARVYALGHYQGDGRTESQDDARGILELLRAAGLSLGDVDLWVGDRAHGGDRRGGYKSNQRLQAAIAEALGYDTRTPGWMGKLPKALQYIETPRKYARSHLEGAEVLHRLMVAKRITVDPSCAPLIHDIERWQGDRLAPEKDGIDSLRYGVVGLMEQALRR
jgi:hypothetical protein